MSSPAVPLLQIIYISNLAVPFDDQMLASLLHKARAANIVNAVTGVLLHHQRCFVQCIEGPPETIDALFQRISQDSRHTNVIRLLRRNISERQFPNWSMGCTHIDDSQLLQLNTTEWETISPQLETSENPGVRFMLDFWQNGRENLF